MADTLKFRRRVLLGLLLMAVPLPSIAQENQSRTPEISIEPLPQGIASFGAVRLDDWVYVYSGHTGKTHTYSKDDMLKGFYRVSLSKGGTWESLPFTTPAQGVALIADTSRIYRIGGMQARNEREASADLYSLTEVAAYDPSVDKWESLPDLPEPRSSHRAALLDNKIYVFGGWSIKGGESGDWQKHGLVLDLSKQSDGWQALEQPAERRALEVVGARGKVWMIGGLTPDDEVSDEVHCYDPKTQQWSMGPKLPSELPIGNGIAGATQGEELYVGGMDGKIYKLTQDGSKWVEAGQLPTGRIHHRLVMASEQSILTIGGSSRKGHLATSDFVPLRGQN